MNFYYKYLDYILNEDVQGNSQSNIRNPENINQHNFYHNPPVLYYHC
jgi:hypothetical protein